MEPQAEWWPLSGRSSWGPTFWPWNLGFSFLRSISLLIERPIFIHRDWVNPNSNQLHPLLVAHTWCWERRDKSPFTPPSFSFLFLLTWFLFGPQLSSFFHSFFLSFCHLFWLLSCSRTLDSWLLLLLLLLLFCPRFDFGFPLGFDLPSFEKN